MPNTDNLFVAFSPSSLLRMQTWKKKNNQKTLNLFNDANKGSKEGHRAKFLVWSPRSFPAISVFIFYFHNLFKLGHYRGNPAKLPKHEGIVGLSRADWMRSMKKVSKSFSERKFLLPFGKQFLVPWLPIRLICGPFCFPQKNLRLFLSWVPRL